jgi:hypothetical protein
MFEALQGNTFNGTSLTFFADRTDLEGGCVKKRELIVKNETNKTESCLGLTCHFARGRLFLSCSKGRS